MRERVHTRLTLPMGRVGCILYPKLLLTNVLIFLSNFLSINISQDMHNNRLIGLIFTACITQPVIYIPHVLIRFKLTLTGITSTIPPAKHLAPEKLLIVVLFLALRAPAMPRIIRRPW